MRANSYPPRRNGLHQIASTHSISRLLCTHTHTPVQIVYTHRAFCKRCCCSPRLLNFAHNPHAGAIRSRKIPLHTNPTEGYSIAIIQYKMCNYIINNIYRSDAIAQSGKFSFLSFWFVHARRLYAFLAVCIIYPNKMHIALTKAAKEIHEAVGVRARKKTQSILCDKCESANIRATHIQTLVCAANGKLTQRKAKNLS